MEEMKKRFDEQFLIRVRNPLGWKLPRIAYFWEQSGKDVEWEDMEVELKSFTQSEVDLAVSKEQEKHLKEVESVLNKYSKSRTEGGLDYVKAFEEMEKYEQKLFSQLNTK